MKLKALIFDVDGTIADTEQYGHLAACNEAFRTFDYPIEWTWEAFVGMQEIPGNAERMRRALQARYPEMAREELATAVSQLADCKKQLYIEKYLPNLPLRSGVVAMMEEALAQGVRMAIVSMSYEEQVHALLRHKLPQFYDHFQPILGKESGPKTAEDSPLYNQCLQALGTAVEETLVIEDSPGGFHAARRAGLPCAVIYNSYTFGSDFSGAQLVARSLEPFTLAQLAALCLPPFKPLIAAT